MSPYIYCHALIQISWLRVVDRGGGWYSQIWARQGPWTAHPYQKFMGVPPGDDGRSSTYTRVELHKI